MAAITPFFVSIITILNFIGFAIAFDPRPLQDFCVADVTSTVRVNGLPCKDPAKVTADDFFFQGLDVSGNTSNPFGAALKPVSVATVPGLNTLGLTLARLDFGPRGFVPPHYHPRATEVLTVLEGYLEVGFITSAPNNVHYKKILKKGDVFVVPVGLPHYQRNAARIHTAVLAVVNSQNPGIVAVSNGIFGAKPPINSEYLAKAYQLDEATIKRLQSSF